MNNKILYLSLLQRLIKEFKFTNANLKSLPPNPSNSSSTELEASDTEIIGINIYQVGRGINVA